MGPRLCSNLDLVHRGYLDLRRAKAAVRSRELGLVTRAVFSYPLDTRRLHLSVNNWKESHPFPKVPLFGRGSIRGETGTQTACDLPRTPRAWVECLAQVGNAATCGESTRPPTRREWRELDDW